MQALYRRYRPRTFDEVVGQETTITALKNQLSEGRVHHAYLFSGTRGTGKTSVAKIFARAVNCLDPHEGNPCNECEVCRGILEETLFDVMEIDAASNNSVDDIREIKENVAYPPALAKKKVYIIDEVHMLSKGAFNALLKILEEPPSHALFILATTEPEKIPATILSRSQRFTFLRLRDEEIVGELSRILDEEKREYTEDALKIIAAHSDGSMRDSLSILDQIMSLSGEKIDGEMVRKSLGLTEHEGIFRMVDGILSRDPRPVMDAIDQSYRNGRNFQLLLDGLITYFRDLLFYRYAEEVPGQLTEDEARTFKEQANAVEESLAFRTIDLLQKGRESFKYTPNQKIVMELLLLKALRLEDADISEPPVRDEKPKRKAPVLKEKASLLKETEKKPVKPAENSVEEKRSPSPALREEEDHAIMKDDQIDDSTWQQYVQSVQAKSVACGALLKDVAGIAAENKALFIRYAPSFAFHLKMLKSEVNFKILEEAARDILGDEWSVVVEDMKAEDDPVLESMKRVFKDTPIELE